MDNAIKQLKSHNLWRQVTGEFTAMFLFVFICVGCALTTTGAAQGAAPGAAHTATLAISLNFGFTIFVLAHMFGHISGAHINPAVTLGLMIAKQVDVMKSLLFMVAQFLGSITASGVLMVTMGLKAETMGGYNALTGPDDNKVARGFIVEMILTCFLVMTVFATIDPSREDTHMGPWAIGTAVGVAHLVAVPITGCGINPARSLGPALFVDKPEAMADLWVFIVAPFIGATIGALVYPAWFAETNFIGGLYAKYHVKTKVDEGTGSANLPETQV